MVISSQTDHCGQKPLTNVATKDNIAIFYQHGHSGQKPWTNVKTNELPFSSN